MRAWVALINGCGECDHTNVVGVYLTEGAAQTALARAQEHGNQDGDEWCSRPLQMLEEVHIDTRSA